MLPIYAGFALLSASIGSFGLYFLRVRRRGVQMEPHGKNPTELLYLGLALGLGGTLTLIVSVLGPNALAFVWIAAALGAVPQIVHWCAIRSRLGAVLIDLGNLPPQGFWWFLLMVVTIQVTIELIDQGTSAPAFLIAASVFVWGVFGTVSLLGATARTLICENGVATVAGAAYWADIKRYEWEGDTLTLETDHNCFIAWQQTRVPVPKDWVPEVRRVLREKVSWRPTPLETAPFESVPGKVVPLESVAPATPGEPGPLWPVLWFAGMVVIYPATVVARAVRGAHNEL
jgi:hypothetical protein